MDQLEVIANSLQVGSKIKFQPRKRVVNLENCNGNPFNEFMFFKMEVTGTASFLHQLCHDHLKSKKLWVKGPTYYDGADKPLAYLNAHGLEGPTPAQAEVERDQIHTIEWVVIKLEDEKEKKS